MSQIQKKKDFIKFYVGQKNNATASLVDPNSNVTDKNTGTLLSEMYKFENIQVSRSIIKDKLKELFDESVANQYEEDIKNHLIYVHDETLAAFTPYCASVTMYPFLLEGTKILGGTSKAPTNLQSFCGSFVNLVYQLSTNWAGATATVEFLMYFDYFARKQYGNDYLKTNAKEIGQELQGVVYALNQPAAARGNQSVFWNISVFDRFYFNSVFGGFVFPDGTPPEYDSLKELQKFFMDWFRQERKKELLTYPVLTAAILLGEDNKPKDKDFADFIATEMSLGLSFFLYESHSADSLASCCFDDETEVFYKEGRNGEIKKGMFKNLSLGKQYYVCYNGKWNPAKLVKTNPTPEMIEIYTEDGDTIFCTSNHIFPTDSGEFTADEISPFDELYRECLDVGFNVTRRKTKVTDVISHDNYTDSVYCFEVEEGYPPYFVLGNGIITHNCRLRNELADNTFSYTLGAGGVSTGSFRVITINMNRYTQMYEDKLPFKELVERVHKYLVAHREVVKWYIDNGMLPAYTAGFINLSTQFGTIGINGMLEAMEAKAKKNETKSMINNPFNSISGYKKPAITGANKFCIADENCKSPLARVSLSVGTSMGIDAPKAGF